MMSDTDRRALKEEMIPRLRAVLTRAEEDPTLIEWPWRNPVVAKKCIVMDMELLQAIAYVLAFFEPAESDKNVQG